MNRLHRWYCQSNQWKRKLDTEILPWSLDGVDLRGEVLELGPGPGLTTDWLSRHCDHITCLELDPNAAHALRERTSNGNVTVELGDASRMPFRDNLFAVVISCTMLHHIPSSALQDRVFCEAFRVLKPEGLFVGTDSTWSLWMQLFHFADTMIILDPERLPERLEVAGFVDVNVGIRSGRFKFCARRPKSLLSACDSRDVSLVQW